MPIPVGDRGKAGPATIRLEAPICVAWIDLSVNVRLERYERASMSSGRHPAIQPGFIAPDNEAVLRQVASIVVFAVVAVIGVGALASCTTGDGEGGRYIGRVVSASHAAVCVGPSSSSASVTCGAVPRDVRDVPQVGQCVGLFPSKLRAGKVDTWSAASLRAHYDDARCEGTRGR
jgi:hypothetical protein